jgi:GNAT superfamily N-acetyltransferase
MIDYSLIRLIPADETHREFSYQVKKAAEGDYITSMFGWDEDVQRDFHVRAWQEQKPDIITYDGKLIGTIATVESQDCVEIGQFFILPEHQRKGVGTYLLKSILDKADRLGKNVTLKFLKNNPVKSLYVRHGFRVVDTDEILCHMERSTGAGRSSFLAWTT